MAKTWDLEKQAEFDAMMAAAKENGYRKKDVAETLGIPAPTLSDWIVRKHTPHPMFQRMFPVLQKQFERKPKRK
jgi:hypothetical protein